MTSRITAILVATTIGAAIGSCATTANAKIPLSAVGSPSFADIVEKVNPTVVYIKTSILKPDIENSQVKPDDLQTKPEGQHKGKPGELFNHSIGAGFIFSEDGLIVTNEHVVQGAIALEVKLLDGRTFYAKIVASDHETDIAVLKIDARGLPVTPLGASSVMRTGDIVIAIGNPFNYDHTVTSGIVSALNRELDESDHMIQTDAGINPGNSGGPLFNISGEAIGINESMFGPAGSFVGIGFAIPMDDAKVIIQQLITRGAVPHAIVGLKLMEQSPAPGTDDPSIVVAEIEGGGPADQFLRKNDIIRRVDGKPVTSARNILNIVKRHVPGDIIVFQVVREGQLISIPVKSGATR